jgi:hypothetical protein
MAVSINGTTLTFNDATTMTTAATGTVTSVSGTNGLTGTVTTSGSLSLDIYTGTTVQNTSYPIGSYIAALGAGGAAPILNATKAVYCPANGDNNNCVYGASSGAGSSALSGTWRSRGLADQNITNQCLFQRIS